MINALRRANIGITSAAPLGVEQHGKGIVTDVVSVSDMCNARTLQLFNKGKEEIGVT
jgi:hypothetical protein